MPVGCSGLLQKAKWGRFAPPQQLAPRGLLGLGDFGTAWSPLGLRAGAQGRIFVPPGGSPVAGG